MRYIPVELQEALKRGECVLFVGAGLSKGLPQWRELMEPLAKELGINRNEDPRYIAEYYENKCERSKLEEKIISRLKKDVPLTKTHKLLADLPVKAIVTTNYDHVLEKALSKKNYIKVIHGREAPLARSDQVPLVKMHGDIDDPSTMIITKTDYDEYPERHRALITYLLSFLISCNFLFVGFGLKDPNFDNIYTQMRSLFKDTHRKSYTVFKNPPEHEVRRLKRMGIEVISIEDYGEIPQIFEELTAMCTQKVKGKPELTPQQLESVQKTFREVVERQNKWLDPRGIFQFERMLTKREVELEDVYVVPRLVKQVITKRKEKPEREEQTLRDSREIYPEDVHDKEPEYTFEKHIELSIKDALSDPKNKHMVILGDPGVGKTCLLQYIASKASTSGGTFKIDNVLPVLIPLREYHQFGKDQMFKKFVFQYINDQICSLPESILEYFLDKNLFFFLLDGLDEITKESQRIGVSRQVERFMARYPNTRIILTSRPAGYKPAALIGSIPHFTLADFTNEEIKEFLVKWFTFLDTIEEEKFERDKTEKKAYELADVIVKREKILHLARNPLLLTILVLIHRVGKTLPERRAEFYDLAVRTISGSWESWKSLQVDKKIPDQDTILVVLENIGFRLHSENQENVVEPEELKVWLKRAMEEEMGHSSKEEINDFIWMLDQRAGLLVEKGLGLYGFVHLTFQEYFAARYIALGRGVKLAERLVKEKLHSSRWREVFLLAAAIARREQADLILDSALEAENPFEKYIHSNVMAAGLMLADLPRVTSAKRKEVIERLISFTGSDNIDVLRLDALEVLAEIGRTSPIEDDSWALELLRDEDWDVRGQAVAYFTTVGADDQKIREQIFELLRDEDSVVRMQAVAYFATVGADDLKIREKFFELLRDEDSVVREQAVVYFATVGADDQKIKEQVFELLRDEYWSVRRQAVVYFATVGADDQKIREQFFELLRDEYSFVRRQAVVYFATVGADDLKIKEQFFELLRDKDWSVREQAGAYFATVEADDLKIKEQFFELLRDENSYVRRQAVAYFTTVGADDQKIREHIFELLRDENSYVREQAVAYFATVGADDLKIREQVFELLRDEYSFVREQAVKFLSRYAGEESLKRAPLLFKSSHQPTKRGAYNLMKALLQTQEKS